MIKNIFLLFTVLLGLNPSIAAEKDDGINCTSLLANEKGVFKNKNVVSIKPKLTQNSAKSEKNTKAGDVFYLGEPPVRSPQKELQREAGFEIINNVFANEQNLLHREEYFSFVKEKILDWAYVLYQIPNLKGYLPHIKNSMEYTLSLIDEYTWESVRVEGSVVFLKLEDNLIKLFKELETYFVLLKKMELELYEETSLVTELNKDLIPLNKIFQEFTFYSFYSQLMAAQELFKRAGFEENDLRMLALSFSKGEPIKWQAELKKLTEMAEKIKGLTSIYRLETLNKVFKNSFELSVKENGDISSQEIEWAQKTLFDFKRFIIMQDDPKMDFGKTFHGEMSPVLDY